MNELVHIGNADIAVKEYKGQRVVTFKDIDELHEKAKGTANKRFIDNRTHFILDEDYFIVSNSEIRKSQLIPISDNDFMDKALITESGYLMLVKSFTDDLAWEVQRKLVDGYFRASAVQQLSPELQMFKSIFDAVAKQELEIKQTKELAARAIETTESIKEAVKPISDNWRYEINAKFNRIQHNNDCAFASLRTEMYAELERRAGCDLDARLRNRRQKMSEDGCTKTKINTLSKMDIIEADKKLREIFGKIVCEYEIKYCA